MSGSPTPLPTAPLPRRALLLVNPRARRGGESIAGVVGVLEAAGIAVQREEFRSGIELTDDIRRRRSEIDCVIVCGGDGSLSAAALALMETGLPLGIIPMGTANDLARTLGIPVDPLAAARIIAAGQPRRIDLGTVNGHPFFNVASIGLAAELARRLDPATKRRWGRLGYALTAVRVLLSARRFRAWLTVKGHRFMVKTYQIAVGNGRHYGGGTVVEASAAIDDGHLDLYSLEMRGLWRLLAMARSFRAGTHGAFREVRTQRCVTFTVETRKARSVNTDGELVTTTPAVFVVHPAAITVYAPPPITPPAADAAVRCR